ncbi:geranylgeranyl diphosphate synthase type II [Natronocella acetinitrilica]|jgi:geranylgeranyl diphosphate synthase, type II|uniref:Geranylgeranyl diphosphate synthase type II n=1 Tax=Natronocella acetinitrilica TaxID=414046 RepID=A0AAE3G7K0_9GAMM|nr:polyprenyl synthetase family protein [Natronocella acetinitrilica]MCP1675838.1 geranylgeranyl diphosphate synthase type II [Natronocella acetinitrilica]
MEPNLRIEQALTRAIDLATAPPGPPRLSSAIRHAVFAGGARVRPKLCLSVALACGDDRPALSDAMATALELLHCASLVHDDLPCFDNADLRRGLPSVHKAYGEQLAVLAGDALIVTAFQVLGIVATSAPTRSGRMLATLATAGGARTGIAAGQAWECEEQVSLPDYHRAKTGALFAAATVGGASAAGADAEPWRALGEKLGEAYQVGDDLRDAICTEQAIGKPVGQDPLNGRPSAVAELGIEGSRRRLDRLVQDALRSIPPCPGRDLLRAGILQEMHRVLPCKLSMVAA